MRRILKRHWGTIDPSNEINTAGKTIVVTGANHGIGKATVSEILGRNTNVNIIMACRDMNKAQEALKELQGINTQATVTAMELDLADLDSVRKFSTEFNSKYDKLHILINNAGVHLSTNLGRLCTKQGFEMHFGVNYLGHFLLTNLLLDKLKKGAPSRVVTMSASLAANTTLDFTDLNFERRGIPTAFINPASIASTLARAMFSEELSKRYNSQGIHTYAVCPGMVLVNTGDNMSIFTKWTLPLVRYFVQGPNEGCLTCVYCALNKDLGDKSGKFYRRCEEFDIRYRENSEKDRERLWEESEKLVGL